MLYFFIFFYISKCLYSAVSICDACAMRPVERHPVLDGHSRTFYVCKHPLVLALQLVKWFTKILE